MPERYTDRELENEVLAKLWRRGLFGGRYQPVEQALSSVPVEVRKRARELLGELKKEGLLEHSMKSCWISLDRVKPVGFHKP